MKMILTRTVSFDISDPKQRTMMDDFLKESYDLGYWKIETKKLEGNNLEVTTIKEETL